MALPRYISAEQIADAIGNVTPAYVRDDLSRSPGFPAAHRFGQNLRWRADEVDEWMDKQRVSRTSRRRRQLEVR